MLNRITSKAFIKAKTVSAAKNFIPVASVKKYATDILADAFRASKVDDVASLNNGSKTFAKNFVDFLNLKSLKKSKKIKASRHYGARLYVCLSYLRSVRIPRSIT